MLGTVDIIGTVDAEGRRLQQIISGHLARVLVTGASGTLGYNIVRHVATAHPRTRLHVLLRRPDPMLFADLPNVGQQKADMDDIARFCEAVVDFHPTAIVHCAASGVRPSRTDWFDVIERNVAATVQLFRAACELDDCHFIQISTGLVYDSQTRPCHEGDPIDTLHPYGATKAAADCLLRAGAKRLNRHLTVVRPFSFTGIHDGGDRLFPSLLRNALHGTPFSMSPGTQIRDFCAVQDVAAAVALILENGTGPGPDANYAIFNVGSGRAVPLRTIVEDVVRQLDLDVDLQFGDLPFHPQEPAQLVADINRMKALGWTPRTNLAWAVWQLAREDFPELEVGEPERFYE